MTTGFLMMAATGPAGAGGGSDVFNGHRPDDVSHQIAICHANNGANGFSMVFPDRDQIVHDNGHAQGGAVHTGDIIPPFSAGTEGNSHEWDAFSGYNWTTETQAIYDNGCQVPLIQVTPVPYTAEPATCEAPGVLKPQTQPAGVRVEQHPSGTASGTYEIEFEAQDGYTLVGEEKQRITVEGQKSGAECDGSSEAKHVTYVPPTVSAATCTSPAQYTRNPQPDGVEESFVQDSANRLQYTFTYTLTDTAVYAWADGGTAPRSVTLTLEKAKAEQSTDPDGDCYKAPGGGGSDNPGNGTDKPSPTVPTPTAPSPTVPSPTVPTPTVPGENPGGDGGQQPAADKCRNIVGIQHTVPEGMVVKGDGFCAKPTQIKGTETSAPHPDKDGPNQPGPDQQGPNRPGPTIKGVVGVPTAFPAGVPGTAADTGEAGTRAGAPTLLAQLLVTGGLLLMVAAGGLRLRRPARGVHEI